MNKIKVLCLSLAMAGFIFFVSKPAINPALSTQFMEAQGFTKIKTYGYGWNTCPSYFDWATEVSAVNPAGEPVAGVVCLHEREGGVFYGIE